MIVKEVMNTGVATCSPESDLGAVVRIMREHDCGFLPVVDSRGFGYAEATAGGVPLTEIEPAPHAPAEGSRPAIGGVAQLKELEELGGPPLGRLTIDTVEPGLHHEVLPGGEIVVDADELGGVPDPLAHPFWTFRHVHTVDDHRPRCRPQQRDDDADRRRLAGAVGAEKPEDLPLGHPERDVVDGANTREDLHQRLHVDEHGDQEYGSAPRDQPAARMVKPSEVSATIRASMAYWVRTARSGGKTASERS